MSDSDLVQKIVSFDIDIEEEVGDHPLADRTSTGEPREATEQQLTEQEAGMKQEETKEEETKEEEFKVNIKQEILDDEPEDRERDEHGGSGGSLARRQFIYRRLWRDNGATPSTREQAEENQDGEDKLKRKADYETGERGSGEGETGEGTSGESTSAEGASKEKKAKTDPEPCNVENDDFNSKSSSDCSVVFD